MVSAPKCVSHQEILGFVQSQEAWIAKQRSKACVADLFEPDKSFQLFGQTVLLQHQRSHRGKALFQDQRLIIGGDASFFARRVKDFLCEEGLERFRQEADVFAGQLGVTIKSLTLRDTISRWGSCSSDGKISLSWRLSLMPVEIASYVVAHEVTHCKVHDHSPSFWQALSTLVSNSAQAQAWLKFYGPQIMKQGYIPHK